MIDKIEKEFAERVQKRRRIMGVYGAKRSVRREMAYELIEESDLDERVKEALYMIITMNDS